MTKLTVLQDHPISMGAGAIYPYTDELMGLCARKSRYDGEYSMARVIGTGENRRIMVPRNMAPGVGGMDLRASGLSVKFKSSFKPRNSEQKRVIDETVERLGYGMNFMMEAPTGFGKCSPAGTPVIMYDGTIKTVENVVEGDVLMGPDSQPRTVYGTHKSWSPIYRITPIKGEPFECNDVHILSLKCTATMGGGKTYQKGAITNIEVKDYIKQSGTFKHMMKLWRAPGIDLPERKVFYPYLVGLYLADGVMERDPRLCCGEIKKPALDYVESVTKVGTKYFDQGAWYYPLPEFRDTQKMLTRNGQRHIPDRYLRNSRDNRLQLLAGLLDGDGHLVKGTVFELTCKDDAFKDQVLWLCRSLGFAAYASKATKGIKETGFTGEYWRICISGDTDQIPTKIPSKQAQPRAQKKDHLVTGFKVEYVRDDWVYGFGLDKDHLYLLGDFTVTHNTWCAMDVIARIGLKTIIVVTKEDIRDQWIAAAEALLGLSVGKGIGLIQGDTFNVAGQSVVIAMIQSLSKDGRYPEHAFKDFGLAIWDECFHPSHDLLTARGWVPVAEVTKDDLVAQVDQDTKQVSFVKPEKVIAKKFFGSLIHLEGQKADLLATPNHQHLTYWDGVEPRKVEFKDFNPQSRGHTLYAPTPGPEEELSLQEKLAFAFQADGHLVRQRSDGLWYVKFSFRRQRKIDRMEGLLAGSGYEWTKRVNSRGDTTFRVWLDWKPTKSLSWVPATLPSGWYVSALDEIAEWDGWRTDTGVHFESDLSNCEVVQMIATLAGRVSTIRAVKKQYRVNAWQGALRDSKSIRKHEVPYEGLVHCVRMPKGTVIARRNGKVVVTGNCHRVAADNFSQSAYRIPAKLRLGISATPDRKDGKEEVLYAHIGRIRVRTEATPMTPRVIRQESPWDCPMRRKRNEDGTIDLVPIDHSAGAATHVVKLLANHHGRNTLIAKFVAAAFKKGRKVLVQSDLKDHLDTLVPLICKQGVPMAEIAFYVGGMKSGARENAKTKSVIMATYQMTAEATDIPTLDTLVMGTPKSDVRQIVGRVIRFLEDKKEPVVFDIVDSSSPIFHGYAKARAKWYKSIGASVGGIQKQGAAN